MSKLLGVHIPADIKNIAINGNMDFWQRVEANSTTLTTNGSGGYIGPDMFSTTIGGTTTKSATVVRSTNVPSLAQSGWASTYSMQFTNNTAVPTLAAGDYYQPFVYKMEGFDYQKIHGKIATFGFWFYTTLAGTYSFSMRAAAYTRAYITTFSAVVGWQFVSITVQMDTAAGYAFDTGLGLEVNIAALTGTTYQAAPSTSWQAVASAASTATNYAATAGVVLNVSQFSIVEGPVGFGPRGFERAGDSIQAELALAQRHYQKTYDLGVAVGTANAAGPFMNICLNSGDLYSYGIFNFKVQMRAAPTVTGWNPVVAATASTFYDYNASGQNGSIGCDRISTTCISHIYNISQSWQAQRLVGIHLTMDAGL